jgi:hypothetical protein
VGQDFFERRSRHEGVKRGELWIDHTKTALERFWEALVKAPDIAKWKEYSANEKKFFNDVVA